MPSMQVPSTLSIWLSEQVLPFAIIMIVLSLALSVLFFSSRRRSRNLNQARLGMNEDTLVESLILDGFDPTICRTVYRYLQDEQNVYFPIKASDLLDEDLGLDLDAMDETIQDVLRLTHRVYLPGLRHAPIITVEDMVRFVQACPRMRERAA